MKMKWLSHTVLLVLMGGLLLVRSELPNDNDEDDLADVEEEEPTRSTPPEAKV